MYLGIDIGTSATKTLIIDEAGNVKRFAISEYPLSTPRNGWAEQDPRLWWNAVLITIKETISEIDAHEIKAIGLTGQMHGLVALDESDNVLRPAILWCDQRTAQQCEEITTTIGAERLIELTANPALTGFTAPKILWVRSNEPKVYEKIAKVMLPKDYIRYLLTGENASDVSDASGTGFFNVANRTWDSEVLSKLKIESKWLGKVYESPEITGKITRGAAELTGLPTGTPVIAGAGDNAAAAIGTGVARDGQAFVTIGSSGVVFAHTSKMRLDNKGRLHTFCAAVPGEWHIMGVTLAAGLSYKWFKENFAQDISYAKLDEMADAIPIGADNLLFLPYLNGERSPHLDPDARGAFIGLASTHEVGHLARSVMEGVAYSLRDCYDIILNMGIRSDEIIGCGGGMISKFWRQMVADTFGVKVATCQTSDGPALGAAMLAAVGSGAYASVPEICESAIERVETIEPNLGAGKEYKRFHSIYKDLYSALQTTFGRLNTSEN